MRKLSSDGGLASARKQTETIVIARSTGGQVSEGNCHKIFHWRRTDFLPAKMAFLYIFFEGDREGEEEEEKEEKEEKEEEEEEKEEKEEEEETKMQRQ